MKKIDNSNLILLFSVVLAGLLIFVSIYYSNKNPTPKNENINNVSIDDGKQIIVITARGGYSPVHSTAKAGIPTIIRVDTSNTFDCSSSIRIPSMNISKNLPMTGTTDIDIGIQEKGIFTGTCGMGMYPFDIKFE